MRNQKVAPGTSALVQSKAWDTSLMELLKDTPITEQKNKPKQYLFNVETPEYCQHLLRASQYWHTSPSKGSTANMTIGTMKKSPSSLNTGQSLSTHTKPYPNQQNALLLALLAKEVCVHGLELLSPFSSSVDQDRWIKLEVDIDRWISNLLGISSQSSQNGERHA